MGLSNTRGEAAEDLAVAYLELIGCRVRARNVRIGGVEVDVLVNEGRDTVVVEVKYRSRSDFGGAAAAIDAIKRERLLRAASALLGRGEPSVRIDVVTVELAPGEAWVRHHRGAVTA